MEQSYLNLLLIGIQDTQFDRVHHTVYPFYTLSVVCYYWDGLSLLHKSNNKVIYNQVIRE